MSDNQSAADDAALNESELPFPLVRRGKVRDVYDVGKRRLLLVATDRISAFDVVLPQPIPGKGEVLTQLTAWWLSRVQDLTPHHLISADPDRIIEAVPELADSRERWERRAMLCHAAEPIMVECVVRGYITGSAWREYGRSGTLAGEALPEGLRESQRLDPPIFSPATKAVEGHDENITFTAMKELLGPELAETLRERSLAIYQRGRETAGDEGIIIADTKFEFGTLPDDTIILIDEVLTPDSSRFWPADSYAVGRGQPSLDKQPVRDFLDRLVQAGDWDKQPPGPDLPPEVVEATSSRYREVFRRLTGSGVDEFSSAGPDVESSTRSPRRE